MTNTLKLFTTSSLFEATSALLAKLNIRFNRQTAEPINVADLYDGAMPQYLTNALQLIEHTYFIGVANDLSLDTGEKSDYTLLDQDEDVFVSKYELNIPSKERMTEFLRKENEVF